MPKAVDIKPSFEVSLSLLSHVARVSRLVLVLFTSTLSLLSPLLPL